jgi:hypothetical protein
MQGRDGDGFSEAARAGEEEILATRGHLVQVSGFVNVLVAAFNDAPEIL